MKALKRKTITVEWLREQSACPDQVKLFADTFGQSATITPELIRRAAEVKLDLDWAAKNLLMAPAWAAYEQAKAPALIAICFGHEISQPAA